MKKSKHTTKPSFHSQTSSRIAAAKPAPELEVSKEITLSFSECGRDDIPTDKSQVKRVLETLASFSSAEKHKARNPHPLKEGSKNKRVNQIIQDNKGKTIMSLDAGHRNGKDGNFRLLYYKDANNSVARILRLFIDTH